MATILGSTLAKHYQEFIIRDLLRLQEQLGEDPLTFPFFFVRGQAPVWMDSFEDKSEKMGMTRSQEIYDERVLTKYEIPRQYRFIRLEREMIPTLRGETGIIERMYYCSMGDAMYPAVRTLVAVTSVTRHYPKDAETTEMLNIFTHFFDQPYPKGRIFETGKQPRHYFEVTKPLAFY